MDKALLFAAVACPIGFAVLIAMTRPRQALWILTGVTVLEAALLVAMGSYVSSGRALTVDLVWVEALGSHLNLQADGLSILVAGAVTLVALGTAVYTHFYLKPEAVGSAFFALNSLFLGSMIGVVLAGDMLLLYLFWELMLLPSTALVVHWGHGKNPYRTGLKYFIVTHIGAVLMLAGIISISVMTGSTSMEAAEAFLVNAPARTVVILGGLFIAGFGVKMAIIPGHVWLPDAHSEAQLPTSIMLSAAMMNMGIYGLIRFLADILPSSALLYWSGLLVALGLANQWYGGIQALRQTELKRMAAFSTISQMGYVLIGIGAGTATGLRGAMMQLVAHGLGKALLFMVIGIVMHTTGAHSFDEVHGLGRKMPVTMLCAVVSGLALAGAPPFAAFQSEWQILSAVMSANGFVPALLAVAGGVLTALYCLHFVRRVFYGESHEPVDGAAQPAKEPLGLLVPMLGAAALSLTFGLVPALLTGWVNAALRMMTH